MSQNFTITVLPGDGIGPEVIEQAVNVMKVVEELEGVSFSFEYARLGGCAIDEDGTPLPQDTLEKARRSDAVLLGAVGGPKWDNNPAHLRPETGLLGIRKELGLYANLRPAFMLDCMVGVSALREEVVQGVDLMVIRELTGGLYFGEKKRYETEKGEVASDELIYYEYEIERIVRRAFEVARLRSKKLTSVDKANVLESSRLWRKVVDRIAPEYPDVELRHQLVDSCAMELIRWPKQFDTIVTENMFGDILSDEASMLTGSIGMLPSASLADGNFGLYEPVHGSAPDIAGKGIANPTATILSAAMMLRYSFGLEKAANAIEQAVHNVLNSGVRTGDIASNKEEAVGTEEMTNKIIAAMREAYVQA
ncbi:3-isopropylmalate dehydrogenase [Aneurinibacillus aneurinilyticus]|jgi:3-isopropylmalate dehydrogenase|uniref:3-isopropylmalate dehydrogenase n=2 Tax=Aneurinibacillus aneurinilyticus TaxID=1391 RepID=A0A848CVX4_ANEAE|nr:3-isopropylmalate dehydrogenase [Aneurinibacillus aneurinilyticus]ERI09606.1 3-isopropylmalate dehydrogenase [Aneurinibacillus aneurinilyticus ATCC 12856]MCI1695275.1 3-isopropylmalate dehydrogenase [Aneurinibacillus aneurinilyticus]MED0671100.1 3-isopropylmalate dehydrogenase [Aneurinibacillus aneurinilyticus]MED0706973.1 3-isopropylmalate dehydrogenase [Aneurinibacillus aneurinilyticus]MED0725044.1 3-isopropylmalate dehydrogenase [Aneurinibacillus aneurinilyticus]